MVQLCQQRARHTAMLLVFLVVAHLCLAQSSNFKVCSFNVQVFGVTKMSNPVVADTLAKIFNRYDFCLIQEIRDASQTAIYNLLNLMNQNKTSSDPRFYSLVLSERLGRTSSKEQYGFFYLGSKLEIVERHQFIDTFDWFERPPFSVFIRPKLSASSTVSASARTMLVTANHIQPTSAPFELDKMVNVYESLLTNTTFSSELRNAVANRWLFMGDFNAGCSYVSNRDWSTIRLRNQTITYRGATVPTFTFLISDQTPTTTAASSGCPYDRFTATPPLVPEYNTNDPTFATTSVQVVQSSAKIFNFTLAYGLDLATTRSVSDHYPIEVDFANFFETPVTPPPSASSPKKMSTASSSVVSTTLAMAVMLFMLLFI